MEQDAVVAPTDSSINIAPPPATPLEPLAILVVDDDAMTRKLMTRILTRLGCNVATAENGVKALEILLGSTFTPSESATLPAIVPSTPGTVNSGSEPLANQPRSFDVVFLDNQMPQMSGLEAVSRLRAAGREDLVVGVTGNALIRDQDEYLNAGVDHVLIKPVLEKSLRRILSLARQRTACKITESL
jgi:CheY-like chemotaxis protein